MRTYWHRVDLGDQIALSKTVNATESLIRIHPAAMLEHDLDWVIHTSDGVREGPLVYLLQEGPSVLGYVPFSSVHSAIVLSLGEIRLCNFPVQQFTLYGQPLIQPGTTDEHEKKALLGLFSQVKDDVRSGEVVFLASVPCGSSLYKILKSPSPLSTHFHILQYAADYKRRMIALPDSFDQYLKQLGSRTRADLNRNIRKLKEHTNDRFLVKCYTAPSSLDEFLQIAETISKKTYQWNLLGRGLSNREHVAERLALASDKGWLRCYVLYCKDQPAAFMIGYHYHGRYYSTDIGYAPEWGTWSAGNVLHCEVVRDLIEKVPEIRLFDFMGDRPTHERLSNGAFFEEATFYLFPRTFQGTAVYILLWLTDGLSIVAARMLDKLHLKTWLRQWIRKISTYTGSS